MAATPETLALAALVILPFLLATAVLFLRFRRPQQQRRWPQQEEILPPPPTDPAAPLETPIAPVPEGEEEPTGEGGNEKQQQRRRRRTRRKRQQQEEGDAAEPSAKTAEGKGESLLPRRPQFPVASVPCSLQRRLNERYDDLARASEAHCLTIEQVRACCAFHYLLPLPCTSTTRSANMFLRR